MAAKPWKIYAYKGCGTCRKALSWLESQGIAHEVHPIRETPPSIKELELMLKSVDGDLRRLFNTSGQDYRSLNMKEKLPGMSTGEALALLSSNGNLIKRPFTLLPGGQGLVGYKAEEWEKARD